MMNESLLTIVIPCYNEAEEIPSAMPDILAACRKNSWKLIVVDDGSRDGSLERLRAFEGEGARILHHKLNRGYGAAIKTGILAADTKYVVTLDADGQHDPADVEKLLALALEKDADMVVGGRPADSSGAYRSLGKKVIRAVTHLLVDFSVRDQNSGLKLYDRELALPLLPLTPDNMAYSDIILLLFADRRHLILEEPIRIRPRRNGKSTISTRTAVDTLTEIFNLVIMFHPMKIFFPVFLFLFICGVAWSCRSLILGQVLSIGGSFLLLASMLVLLFGTIAEQFRRLSRK